AARPRLRARRPAPGAAGDGRPAGAAQGADHAALADRRGARPPPDRAARGGLHTLGASLGGVVPQLARDVDEALGRYYPGASWRGETLFRFGSWIGGDRDGNPNVDATVTAETLRFHRERALAPHLASLEELARALSVAGRATDDLLSSIE